MTIYLLYNMTIYLWLIKNYNMFCIHAWKNITVKNQQYLNDSVTKIVAKFTQHQKAKNCVDVYKVEWKNYVVRDFLKGEKIGQFLVLPPNIFHTDVGKHFFSEGRIIIQEYDWTLRKHFR